MPVVSSKINQQELDAVAEYANRHGITVSNLIRMVLVREVAAPKNLAAKMFKIHTATLISMFIESDVNKKRWMPAGIPLCMSTAVLQSGLRPD